MAGTKLQEGTYIGCSMCGILDPESRLFALARKGKRQPTALEGIGVVFIAIALVIPGQMLSRIARLIFANGDPSLDSSIFENIFGFLPVYLALWAWLRFFVQRSFRSLGLENRERVRRVLLGGLAGTLMVGTTAVLAILPGATIAAGSQTSLAAAAGIGSLSLLGTSYKDPQKKYCSGVGCCR